jgi:hypothetical protein
MFYFYSSFIAWRENINKLYICAKLLMMYYAISHHHQFNTIIRIQIINHMVKFLIGQCVFTSLSRVKCESEFIYVAELFAMMIGNIFYIVLMDDFDPMYRVEAV